MMYNIGRSVLANTRNVFTSAIRRGGDHHDHGGIPGGNMPFDINSRHKLAVIMVMWFGSGFATPFLLMAFQLNKKNQD